MSQSPFYRPDKPESLLPFAANLVRQAGIRERTKALCEAILAPDGLDRTEYIKKTAESLLRALEREQ